MIKKRLDSAPATKQSSTASAELLIKKIFGNKRKSGLKFPSGKTPAEEKISGPHGSNARKCCSRYKPKTTRKMLNWPAVQWVFIFIICMVLRIEVANRMRVSRDGSATELGDFC